MNKIVAIISSILCFGALSAFAQGEETRFRPGEFEVSPFATYVDKSGDKWGVGASVTYFMTSYLGFGASTYWTDFGGTFFDNAAGEAYLRLPLFKVVSPYAVGSVGYQFDSEEWFETLGAGVDFRPFKRISAFSDLQYRFANETNDGVLVRLGVRFAF
jgi:hypothetical protein